MHWTADMVDAIVDEARALGLGHFMGPLVLRCDHRDTFEVGCLAIVAIEAHKVELDP